MITPVTPEVIDISGLKKAIEMHHDWERIPAKEIPGYPLLRREDFEGLIGEKRLILKAIEENKNLNKALQLVEEYLDEHKFLLSRGVEEQGGWGQGKWVEYYSNLKEQLERRITGLKAIPKAEAGTHPLILKQYPIGEVPEKMEVDLEIPIPPPRKPKDVPENAVIRTNEKFDNTIKHLGYESVSFTQEELNGLGKSIPTDVDIINDSQRRLRSAEVVPDEKLGSRQLRHLKLARVVATPVSVYAAVIPPASDRVRTAGLYGTTTGVIYINLDQLYSGRTTVDTLVHELGHHREYRQTGSAEDLSKAHAEAMTDVAARVVEDVNKGTFDELLKEVSW